MVNVSKSLPDIDGPSIIFPCALAWNVVVNAATLSTSGMGNIASDMNVDVSKQYLQPSNPPPCSPSLRRCSASLSCACIWALNSCIFLQLSSYCLLSRISVNSHLFFASCKELKLSLASKCGHFILHQRWLIPCVEGAPYLTLHNPQFKSIQTKSMLCKNRHDATLPRAFIQTKLMLKYPMD